jgi:hypothetical protein
MEIVNFHGNAQVGASGKCPHCGKASYFKPVGNAHTESSGAELTICQAAQCEACKDFVLVVARRNTTQQQQFRLLYFYPLGKPNDAIDAAGVPPKITDDFKEALRCRWVNAFRATVTMCRRAIQASCLEKKADPKKRLWEQIDELAKNSLITEPLRQFAHEVRLEGNDGAHPDPDGLNDVVEKDADDIIAFTREYLHHVYVMPDLLAKRKATASAPAGTA